MTAEDIKTRVESIIDISLSDSDFLDYANERQQQIYDTRDWKFLEKVDTSNTLSSSNDWDTMKDLPTDFGKMLSIYVDNYEYTEVTYVNRQASKDLSSRYYVDYANDQFAFLGNVGSSHTVYLYYIERLDDMVLISETPSLPTRFHRLLAYGIAIDYLSYMEAEEGTITDKIIARLERRYDKIYNDLEMWDGQQQSKAMNYGNTSVPDTRDINDGYISEI